MPAAQALLGVAIVVDFWQLAHMLLCMGVVERKQELVENIVRLRRAARASPGNEDISAVRVSLERELGETVSRRLAARVLGVSHTALVRWIKDGDLPVIYSTKDRLEIPVPTLLDLYETVQRTRETGGRRYVLAPTMTRQRQAARRLRVDSIAGGHDAGHARATARSLAYHRAVSDRLRKPMVEEARHVLFRWRQQDRIDSRYADRWKQVLAQPVPEIRRVLVSEGSEFDDLRQNSPFAGLLSEPERRRILQEIG